jgi:hypothetical protein
LTAGTVVVSTTIVVGGWAVVVRGGLTVIWIKVQGGLVAGYNYAAYATASIGSALAAGWQAIQSRLQAFWVATQSMLATTWQQIANIASQTASRIATWSSQVWSWMCTRTSQWWANAQSYVNWLRQYSQKVNEASQRFREAQNGTRAAFDAAQKAWRNLPPDVRSMMHGINNGSRPLSDFARLPAAQRQAILDYYRATAANASKANAEAVRRLNQHRIDFLNGLRRDPPGGIGNF